MRIVAKKPSWKHITFRTPKINFNNWAKNGITIRIKDKEYIFKDPKAGSNISNLTIDIFPPWVFSQPSSAFVICVRNCY